MCAIGLFQLRLSIFFYFLLSSGTNRRRTDLYPVEAVSNVIKTGCWKLPQLFDFLLFCKRGIDNPVNGVYITSRGENADEKLDRQYQ